MKKLLFVLSVLIMAGSSSYVRAESSASGYEDHLRSQQVFSSFYNGGSVDISRDQPVILRAGATAGSTLGADIEATITTDSVFTVGVADETIAVGTMGRVCIRGPHKVAVANSFSGQATGAILSTSTTIGKAGVYSRSDGTVGGQLGVLINTTATTDTGDASNTFWGWINPQVHK